MRKIIFVEGVSGVGKSTMAVKLCDAIIGHGFRAAFHLEGDADNPVDLFNCAYLSKAGFLQLLQDYLSDTDALMNNSISETDYVLVRYGDRNMTYFNSPLFDAL